MLSPDFAVALGRARESTRVAIMDDGGTRAWFPFDLDEQRTGVPAGKGLTHEMAVAHEPGFVCDVDALLRVCGWHALKYSRFTDGPFPVPAGRGGRRLEYVRHVCPLVDIADGYDAYLADLRGRSRSTVPQLLRHGRRLRRDHEVRIDHDVTDRRLIRTMIEWKVAWLRREGLAVTLPATDASVELVHSVATVNEPTCRGSLIVMHVDDRPAAFQLTVRDDTITRGLFIANGTEFARRSPGMLVLLAAIEQAAAHGSRVFDLGAGDQPYKATLATTAAHTVDGVLVRRGPVGTALLARHGAEERARKFVMDNPRVRAKVVDRRRAYGARREQAGRNP